MSLLQAYSTDFPQEVRARGDEYQRQGRVNIIDSGPTFVEAEVDGSRVYRATIDAEPTGRIYNCTCEYFEEHGPCKHLWALALEAIRSNALPRIEAPPEPRVVDEDEDEAPVNDDDESGDIDYGAMPPELAEMRQMNPTELLDALRYPRAAPFAAAQPPAASRNPDELWKTQLSRLSEAMRMQPVVTPRPLNWPTGRRVLYVVDIESSQRVGLVIELMQETAKRDGVFERPKPLRLTQTQIAQLPEETDRQLIQLLHGATRSELGFYDPPLEASYQVDMTAYEDVLRAACATGRCRMAARDGKALSTLTWDDGPAWEFSLRIRPSPGGRYLNLEGALQRPIAKHPDILSAALPAPIDPDDALDEGWHEEGEPNTEPAAAEVETAEVAVLAEEAAAPVDEAPPTQEGEQPPSEEPAEVEEIALDEPHLLLNGAGTGYVFIHNQISRLQHFDAYPLVSTLRSGEKISVPLDKQRELLKALLKFPRLPKLELPAQLDIRQVSPVPRPKLKIGSGGTAPAPTGRSSGGSSNVRDGLVARLSFDYDGVLVDSADTKAAIMVDDGQKLIRRNAHLEATFLAELPGLGFREDYNYWTNTRDLRLPLNKMPKAIAELTRKGWTVEADGKLYRSAGPMNVSISSGIDWFELRGDVSFDGMTASLPRLLAAVRKGQTVIQLDDGTFGLLPEEWLKKYAGIAAMGEAEGDHIKFNSRQIGFLDALLSSLPEARFDETFRQARDELMRFNGIEAIEPPPTFIGTLRQYQSEGLGWMKFLRKFGFGGVLADDMGLGKTVQVLALLEARRRERAAAIPAAAEAKAEVNGATAAANGNGDHPQPRNTNPVAPSLVVAPRSLIFNWRQEALKFSPQLRVLDHTAVDRIRSADHFKDYDLILTTYGTLRRDMSYFREFRFDYAILDEAQAIKNGSSESAKAARLVQCDHRLALSGTPVQNHLGELWSLFDYLNPGMMGSVGVFRDLSADAANRDATARDLLSRSLRPFVLRRTKEQVAKDLPEKQEQTIICELEKDQRKLYDELRDHYRTSLLDRVAREGMNKAKIMVLEALLRLRQAACHPGLIDKKRSDEPSAKLEALMNHITEVVDEGHKVLIFSQFTSMLAIVRDRLDKQQFVYEYLDGRTKDRQSHVDRFQNDPECMLFLISLKAGGVGLNLTAAEYVFLLDPWWNPAVEAQAIDRAHRIGQTQRVFAYRLIAKDTVEEKVVQLQQSKRELADAIINADNSLIRGLSREDLEMLLS